jgi:arylsulfatase A-like enzyme
MTDLLKQLLPVVIAGLVGFSVGRWGVDPEVVRVDAKAEAGSVDAPVVQLAPEHLKDKPNIILITVDTLRADHLKAYGYDRPTSPWLGRLAKEGVLFERAYGGSSWTVPSMATIFTGLYPFQHGVDRGLVQRGEVTRQPALGPEHQTLAEQLKGAGYSTYGVATNTHLTEQLGFAQGFDHFEHQGYAPAADIHDVVANWATELRSSEPYFLWLHFFDPHDKYVPRRPWVEDFDIMAAKEVPELAAQSALERDRRLREWSTKVMTTMRRAEETKTPAVLSTLETLYDSEIRYTDRWIRKIMDLIEPSPDTVVVFTSDHGEEFRDHGDLGHRTTLYNEQTRIPLVISAPGRIPAGSRIAETVTLTDLLPTLVHLGTGEAPPTGANGSESLLPVMTGEVMQPPSKAVLMSTRRNGALLKAIVLDDLKLIVNQKTRATELYDLASDFGETTDLAASRPADVQRLRAKMNHMRKTVPTFESHSVDEVLSAETIEHLRGLGYVDN